MVKAIDRILDGLKLFFKVVITFLGFIALEMPFIAFIAGYTPWVLLAYAPVILLISYLIGKAE